MTACLLKLWLNKGWLIINVWHACTLQRVIVVIHLLVVINTARPSRDTIDTLPKSFFVYSSSCMLSRRSDLYVWLYTWFSTTWLVLSPPGQNQTIQTRIHICLRGAGLWSNLFCASVLVSELIVFTTFWFYICVHCSYAEHSTTLWTRNILYRFPSLYKLVISNCNLGYETIDMVNYGGGDNVSIRRFCPICR